MMASAKALRPTKPDKLAAGERLRVLREQHGLTQLQLAEKIGVDRVVIISYEKGRNQMSSYSAREKLAAVFSMTVPDFSEVLAGTMTAEVATARGKAKAKTMSNLDIAVAFLGDSASQEAVRVVRAAVTDPDALSPRDYAKDILDAQDRLARSVLPRG